MIDTLNLAGRMIPATEHTGTEVLRGRPAYAYEELLAGEHHVVWPLAPEPTLRRIRAAYRWGAKFRLHEGVMAQVPWPQEVSRRDPQYNPDGLYIRLNVFGDDGQLDRPSAERIRSALGFLPAEHIHSAPAYVADKEGLAMVTGASLLSAAGVSPHERFVALHIQRQLAEGTLIDGQYIDEFEAACMAASYILPFMTSLDS